MPVKETQAKYPVIDSDPHFSRVIRYMRPSDYAVWAGATAAGPGLFWLYEKADPTQAAKASLRSALRLTGFLGFAAGFMLAYQNSSLRFWGWRENSAEVTKDQAELSERAKNGQPLYGETELTPYLQGVAARNSTFSQLKLHAFPWFNVANHNVHGVDTSKYGADKQPS
ncbi:hypothetical protein I302_107323 [Kwoniella bestiolae CBS 10118]|uniref:Uncharacterized protein n=1 Tax=Kwoniella bestiolae CBS 10118 TaxID=1296100 RepID=A0A1B9FYV7_9TREE|nr:hypothetical protein I302_06942 [Kwoniella bestiolae CBS 10118]OCF23956.1 hypothetical protein I302_06942 [Kwoniella bestiolae CBS 10118]